MDAQQLSVSSPLAVAADRVGAPKRIRIEASRGVTSLNLADLWAHRELVYFLIWRDVKVRYKQTALGAGWAVLQPVMTMAILSVFFGHLANVPSDGLPYSVFSFAALVPWTFFANGLTLASNSLVQNANLLTKVYFPRLAIPIATVMAGIVDFVLSFVVLLGLIAYYRITPTVNIIFLPVFLLMALITCLGVSLWMAALNVQFRDVRFTIPFLVQFWMFATPVAYPSSIVPAPWRMLYSINPMVGVVEGFRWALLGVETEQILMIVMSAIVAVVILIGGMFYFRHMERTFADVV